GHVWIFFSEPVQAREARQLGAFLITETMERRPRHISLEACRKQPSPTHCRRPAHIQRVPFSCSPNVPETHPVGRRTVAETGPLSRPPLKRRSVHLETAGSMTPQRRGAAIPKGELRARLAPQQDRQACSGSKRSYGQTAAPPY